MKVNNSRPVCHKIIIIVSYTRVILMIIIVMIGTIKKYYY